MSVEDSVDTDRNGIRAVCDEAVYRCFASIGEQPSELGDALLQAVVLGLQLFDGLDGEQRQLAIVNGLVSVAVGLDESAVQPPRSAACLRCRHDVL
jgi:hypothetical protein